MKYFFTIILACAFLSGTTQWGSGALWLGGGICFESSSSESTFDGTSTDGPTNNYLDIQLGAQYFLNDNWSVGGSLAYAKESFEETGEDFSSTVSENLFKAKGTAKYWTDCGNPEGQPRRIRPYGALSLAFGTGKAENESTSGGDTFTSTDDIGRFGASLRAGVAYSLVPELVLGLSTGVVKYVSETRTNGDFEFKQNWFELKQSLLRPRISLMWIPNAERILIE